MTNHRLGWLLAAALLLASAACADPDDNAAPTPTSAPSTTTTTTPSVRFAMDWKNGFETRLANSWIIRDCEGDRLNVCIYDGDAFIGDIELNPDYPLDPGDKGADPGAVATRLAHDMINHFGDDRAKGCATFTYKPDTVVDATVGGRPGASGGFTLVDRSGRVVERVRNYYVVTGNKYAIVNADAYAERGGCLGPSEYDPSLTPENFAELETYLDQLVAATPIPDERAEP